MDTAAFPHIVTRILQHILDAEAAPYASLQAVCRQWQEAARARLAAHLTLSLARPCRVTTWSRKGVSTTWTYHLHSGGRSGDRPGGRSAPTPLCEIVFARAGDGREEITTSAAWVLTLIKTLDIVDGPGMRKEVLRYLAERMSNLDYVQCLELEGKHDAVPVLLASVVHPGQFLLRDNTYKRHTLDPARQTVPRQRFAVMDGRDRLAYSLGRGQEEREYCVWHIEPASDIHPTGSDFPACLVVKLLESPDGPPPMLVESSRQALYCITDMFAGLCVGSVVVDVEGREGLSFKDTAAAVLSLPDVKRYVQDTLGLVGSSR